MADNSETTWLLAQSDRALDDVEPLLKTSQSCHNPLEECLQNSDSVVSASESINSTTDQSSGGNRTYVCIDAESLSSDSGHPYTSSSSVQDENSPTVKTLNDTSNKNSSLVTVFAIWNGMMGTSMLSMPWLLVQSGLVMGTVVFIVMTVVCIFTAHLVLNVQYILRLPLPSQSDFNSAMKLILTRRCNVAAVVFSVAVMVGAMLVYWVLMADFLYSSVETFAILGSGAPGQTPSNESLIEGAFCPPRISPTLFNNSSNVLQDSVYRFLWNRTSTAIYLAVILFPLLNIKSPTFFTKFTGLGTVAVMYILAFVTVKAVKFGWNANFTDQSSVHYTALLSPGFPVAIGTLSMALFIHNCLCDVVRSNRNQKNNTRDVMVAYCLVFGTYIYIGLMFYLAWPFSKTCIRDNLLDNFIEIDVLSALGRGFLLFQLCTVFPLLGYMVRSQLMEFLYGDPYPSRCKVYQLNAAVVVCCVLVTIFYPFIGQLTRFSGSFCGMAWIFSFPCLVFLVGKLRRRELLFRHVALHGSIIILGVINFASQFLVNTV